MKKHSLLILSLSSFLLLAGCNQTPTSSSSSEDASSSSISSSSSSTKEESSSKPDETSSSSSMDSVIAIRNGNEDCITLLDIPASPKEGDSITFGYKVKTGYEFKNEVKIVTSSGEEIESIDNKDGTFTFAMPAETVTITLATRNRLYKINKDEESSSLIRLIKCEYTLDYLDNEEYISPTEEDIWAHDSKAEYSRKVKVYLTSSDVLSPTGIVIPELDNQEINLEEGSDFVSFIMPSKSITIKVNSKKNIHPVTFNNSEHISLSLYSKIEGTYTQIDGVTTGDEVYLKATSSDDKYSIKEISYSYSVSYGSDVVTKLTDDYLEDGYYKITVPSLKDGTSLAFSVSEIESGIYAGYSFVGDYYGTQIRAGNGTDAQWSQMYRVSIDDSGLMTFSFDATDDRTDKETYTITSTTNKNSGEAIAVNDKGVSFKFFFNGANLIADSSFTNSSEYITSDLYIAFKGDASFPEQHRGLYDSVIMDSSSYLTVFELDNKENGDKTALYIDGKKKEIVTEGVSIDITEAGTFKPNDFNAQSASYNVLVNGVVKYRLKQTGKYTPARFLLDDYYGEYKLEGSDEVTLVLDGNGGGTYNGDNCTYEVSGENLLIKTTSKNVTISIDIANLTYTVIKEETISNPLVGATFTDNNKVSYDFYDETYFCNISLFFESETICEFSFTEETYEDYSPSNVISEGEYPYTFDGSVVTINATASNQKVEIKLSLSEDGKKLTFLNDVRGSEVSGQSLTKK